MKLCRSDVHQILRYMIRNLNYEIEMNTATQHTYFKLINCLPWMCEVPFPDWFDNSNGFFRVCFFSMIQASLRSADLQMKSKSQ